VNIFKSKVGLVRDIDTYKLHLERLSHRVADQAGQLALQKGKIASLYAVLDDKNTEIGDLKNQGIHGLQCNSGLVEERRIQDRKAGYNLDILRAEQAKLQHLVEEQTRISVAKTAQIDAQCKTITEFQDQFAHIGEIVEHATI